MADLVVDFDGQHLTLDLDGISSKEFKEIRKQTGLSAIEFMTKMEAGISTADIEDLLDVLHWLMVRRAGSNIDLESDDYPFARFMLAFLESNQKETEVPKAETAPAETETAPTSTSSPVGEDGSTVPPSSPTPNGSDASMSEPQVTSGS